MIAEEALIYGVNIVLGWEVTIGNEIVVAEILNWLYNKDNLKKGGYQR